MTRAAILLALSLAGCPAKGPGSPVRRDGGDAGLISGSDGTAAAADANVGAGRVSVKVVWPTAPANVRASPGYTACHTPRRARAKIDTLHGVAGAFVVVADLPVSPAAATPSPATVRLTVRDCAVDPPVLAATGGALEIQSQDEAHTVIVERMGKPWINDDVELAPVTLAHAQLPVLGHTVTIALDEPGAIRVVADGAADDAAWVLAPPHRHAGITDDVGTLGLADVPAGTHTLVAWLPPRAGQTARRATTSVTVVDGETAEVELRFVP